MKKDRAFTIVGLLLIVIVLAVVFFVANSRYHFIQWGGDKTSTIKELYYCPMHPGVTSDRPGECKICGMSLVKRGGGPSLEGQQPSKAGKGKILYYRNPMNPQVHSPVPMKDEMGMDYVPVYAEEGAGAHEGVYISAEKQQLIGVKKQKIEMRDLSGRILTVGTVAYDPDLYVAQQEYLQAIKTRGLLGDANTGYGKEQSESLVSTAKSKLVQMGMSDAEIRRLETAGKAEQNLYLPVGGKVWVYMTIYEYEAGFVKEGLPVEAEAIAYPGQVFKGRIVSMAPMLEPMTRSLKVRALVDNPGNTLKLRMYVNVSLKYDLGQKLAVPEEAVMPTGTRNIVFIADPNGYFSPKNVTLGPKAQGYYEVLDGLKADQEVVTSGNFLVDSESKLNAVLNQMADANK